MKHNYKLLTVLLTVLLFAFTANVKGQELSISCKGAEKNAALIMRLRQEGVQIDRVLNTNKDSKVWQKVVEEAYKAPRYLLERNQHKEVRRFKNEMYLACNSMID